MLKNKDTNKLKIEIKQKYPLVYELDFKNDIDRAKSPQNELNQTEEYCEFICEKGTEISPADFEVIVGRLEEREGRLAGILQEQSFFKNENSLGQERFFSAILPLPEEYDVLNINFRGEAEQRFKMFVYNHFLYQIKKNIKTGSYDEEEQAKKNHINSLQNYAVTFNMEQKNNLPILIGDKLSQYISAQYDCQDTVSLYFDYKSGNIKINNQQWREVNDIDLDYLKYFEIRADFQDDAASFAHDAFYIYKAIYVKNKGYIYLKPITLPKGKYKIFLYYTGEITLEYSKGESGDWEILSDKFRLNENQDLRFRIKMNSGSKLYDMFITSDDFKG